MLFVLLFWDKGPNPDACVSPLALTKFAAIRAQASEGLEVLRALSSADYSRLGILTRKAIMPVEVSRRPWHGTGSM